MLLRRRKYESRRGFTLVELVVVLVILAVLVSVAVPAFSRQLETGRERKAVTEAQACVTAATGLGTQKYTEARTANIQNGSAMPKDALANWAGKVQDARPNITGTLAQREGSGEYLLDPQNTPDGTAAGAAEVKAAAGVDGTVLNFWCNANGQVVYLLYRSADDILVAYANDANSVDNGIVIPTANVPTAAPTPTKTPTPSSTPVPTVTPTETETPEPTPTATPEPVDSPGQIKIYCYDDDGNRLGDVQLFLKCYGYNSENGPRTSSWNSSDYNARGFDIGGWTTTDTNLQTGISYYIVETSIPQYYQRVLTCGFIINQTSDGGYSLSSTQKLDNGCGRVELDDSNPQQLVINIYHKPLQMLTIHRETADGTPVANAVFTIASQWDSNTPLLICKTDANGDASVPLEHTIADNNQHWYAPRFQSLNDSQSLYYLLTGAVPAGTSAAPEVKFNMKWPGSSESFSISPSDSSIPANVTFSGTTITISG